MRGGRGGSGGELLLFFGKIKIGEIKMINGG